MLCSVSDIEPALPVTKLLLSFGTHRLPSSIGPDGWYRSTLSFVPTVIPGALTINDSHSFKPILSCCRDRQTLVLTLSSTGAAYDGYSRALPHLGLFNAQPTAPTSNIAYREHTLR